MNIDELKNRRTEINNLLNNIINLDDYINLKKEYRNITAKLYHNSHRNNEEYKKMKADNKRKYILNHRNKS
jgi:hypothetical protein